MQDESHITITVFVDRLSPALRKIVRIFARLLMLPFVIMFSLGALQATELNWGISLPTIDWMKISYMYLVLLASGIIMTFYLCMNLFIDLFPKKQTSSPNGGPA